MRETLAFCTLFDAAYLTRGLALFESLKRHAPGSTILVLCMDDETYRVLQTLDDPAVTPIPLKVVADQELAFARENRTWEEFIWTCTPVVCEIALQQMQAALVIYVDADVMFFEDPHRLLRALGDGSILIFEHGFSRRHSHQAETMGRFNVGVMVFRNDAKSRECVGWWRTRCIEWCYHRVEPGRMGDQKYLDLWPELFRGVVVAGKSVPGLAPWNFETWTLNEDGEGKLLADGKPVLFVHFSKLTMFGRGDYHLCSGYDIPGIIRRLAYAPYTAELDRQWDRAAALNPQHLKTRLKNQQASNHLRLRLDRLRRRLLRMINVR